MAIFPEYESFDGLGLANLVKTRVISPTELVNAAIERIEALNPEINAVIHKMYDEAQATIGQPIVPGRFAGIPFLLKDLLADYGGAPIRSGSRFTAGWVSPHDSEMVRRFKKAGLVVVGKTNTPEFGFSPVTEPELFGPTRNPWDVRYASGGSSGGSAAAVAAGMVPMAHGGDGAGSIRIPAAYCGLFGFKPSRGRTPTGPSVMRIWQGMVVEHVLTRSVRDSAAMLDVLSGPELGSPIALPKPNIDFLTRLNEPCPPLKIAVTEQPFFDSVVNPEYQTALQKAAKLCEELGHQVAYATPKIDLSNLTLALMIMVAAEAAAAIKVLSQVMQRKEDYQLLETATAVICELGNHFSAKDFAWASYVLDRVGRQMAEFFVDYDVLLTPTVAQPAPLVGQFKPDRIEQSILELLRRMPYGPVLRKLTVQLASKNFKLTPFCPLFNVTGQPAMSVPLFLDQQGMPIGIQFAGRFGEEHLLLQLAQQLEQTDAWQLARHLRFKLS